MLFQQWKHQFTSWLCFGDNRYAEALDLLEKKDTAPAWSTYNDDERSMSQKLYAVLTSYLRGKCAHMVRAESKVKDGFKLWFNLNHEFMPSTRQRSLALAQALGSYPAFGRDRSSLESILNYEQLVLEYEQASGSVYPKELMAATLIKCCQPRLREQIQLSITDTTSYVDIREKIISYERVSKAWTSDQVLKHVTEPYSSGSADGPVPMEVNRVESKGKGKGKNKGKGRGFGAEWSGLFYGRGRGCGRSNKGKGKGKTKGKSKGKKGSNKGGAKGGKKGSGRGKVAYGQCSNCLEYGHWSRDCPNMSVNQVAEKQNVIPPGQATSPAGPTAKASASPVVRRIFQFGTSLPSCPSSPTSPISPALSSVRMVSLYEYDGEQEWTRVSDETEEQEWVILDSGSDVSLPPARYQVDDPHVSLGALQNCQGGALQTAGIRKAELITTTSDGEEILLQHEFIVGNVTSCLVSLGQLYQGGWDGRLRKPKMENCSCNLLEAKYAFLWNSRIALLQSKPMLDRSLMLDNAWHLSAMMSWW